MKGDFTRSTFQPEKHYTSVRMQQGRLQLDSDWNEQVDIEAYLRQAQSVDMIGADSGVPTSGGDSEQPYRDSFKISVTPDGSDLAIAPGSLYVSGTLCELEAGTCFNATIIKDSNRVKVSSLIVDGRPLEKGQWLECTTKGKEKQPKWLQIQTVTPNQRELTFSNANLDNVGQEIQLRRLLTYNTQPDYPNPNDDQPLTKGVYLAYIDVWQRHITAIEDSTIREVALNIPDTTTRTKTVWQLKLKKLDNPEEVTESDKQKKDWKEFFSKQKIESRKPYLSACAKLCPPSDNSASSKTGYQRLENQLYRVEIHEFIPQSKLTFKWSRDNGSIVSAIKDKNIQGNTIIIRKSSSDAWNSSQTGQWIEITNEEIELNGKPGALAPLLRASDTKIEFDISRITNGKILSNATKVRRWEQIKEVAIANPSEQSGWIDLEAGIKVQFEFDKDSVYKTGDYWLIPARSATNDIEWPNDQAKPTPQPLPQLPQGIEHDYCALALVTVNDQGKFEQDKPEQDESEPKNLRDLRIIFPPLMRCLDTAGGIISGTLEVQSGLYVTRKYDKNEKRYITGKLGVGTKKPLARLHVESPTAIHAEGKISSQGNTVTGTGETFERLGIGDAIIIRGSLDKIQTKIVTSPPSNFEGKSLEIDKPFDSDLKDVDFEYQPASDRTSDIVRFVDRDQTTQLLVNAEGKVGIGTSTPYNQLDVLGGVAIGQAYAGKTKAPNNGLLVDGTVGIGLSNPAQKLVVENGNVGIGYNDSEQSAMLAVKENVGIGITKPNAQLHVIGTVQVDAKSDANTLIRLTQNNQSVNIAWQDNGLQFSATNLTGYSFDQPITAQQGIVTNRIENYNNQSLSLQTNNQERIAIASNGNVGIGLTNPAQQLLIVENGQVGIGYNQPNQSATLAVNGNVGIGTPQPEAQLHVVGTVQVETTQDAIALGLLHDNQSVNISFQDSQLKFIAKDLEGYSFDQPLKATQLEGNSLKLSEGATIEVFSTDSNLLHNSDEAVPTEKAVRTYIDREIDEVQATLINKADRAEVETEINELRTNLQTYINGAIAEVQTTLANKPDRTEVEVKINELRAELQTYVNGAITEVQTTLENKAERNGDTKESFKAKSLNVETSIYSKVVATEIINSQTVASVKAISNGFYQISSRALKEEINDLSSQEVAAILRTLNPVKFIYTEDESKTPHAGFIAEDTPDLLTANDKQAIKVVDIVAILTKVAQDHRKTLSDVVKIVKKQQAEIAILTEKVKALEKQNNE